jgi:hypothetical protein
MVELDPTLQTSSLACSHKWTWRHWQWNSVRLHPDETTSCSAAPGSTGGLFHIRSDSNGINRFLLGDLRIVATSPDRIRLCHFPYDPLNAFSVDVGRRRALKMEPIINFPGVHHENER